MNHCIASLLIRDSSSGEWFQAPVKEIAAIFALTDCLISLAKKELDI